MRRNIKRAEQKYTSCERNKNSRKKERTLYCNSKNKRDTERLHDRHWITDNDNANGRKDTDINRNTEKNK